MILFRYQRRRVRSTERHIEALKDRLTRAPLDVAWACRGPMVLEAMLIAETRRRADLRLVGVVEPQSVRVESV